MPFTMIRDDIVTMKVDAIVNSANTSLLGGGGLDGAIHRAAGPELREACRKLNGCAVGSAKITDGYLLPARYIIHTVGPVWKGGSLGEASLLASCYRSCLELADRYHCTTIAFPLISASTYGFPKDQALDIAEHAILDFLRDHDMMVYLVLFGSSGFLAARARVREIQAYIDDRYVDRHVNHVREYRRGQLWQSDAEKALEEDIQFMEDAWEDDLMDAAPKAASMPPRPVAAPKAAEPCSPLLTGSAGAEPDWEKIVAQTDDGFSRTLLRLIDEKGMTDTECYKRANFDRKLFSKIRSNPDYRPTKPTVLAFAIALRLDLDETEDLLETAGFALSHSSRFDIILEYCIHHGIYDIYEINDVLFHFDMPLLGSSMRS